MKKLKPGMFIRTYDGVIAEIEQIVDDEIRFNIRPIFSDGEQLGYNWLYIKDVVEADENIIKIIHKGDYVNGYKVTNIYDSPRKHLEAKTEFDMHWVTLYFYEETIYDVVTKEKFEERKFRVRKNDKINNN